MVNLTCTLAVLTDIAFAVLTSTVLSMSLVYMYVRHLTSKKVITYSRGLNAFFCFLYSLCIVHFRRFIMASDGQLQQNTGTQTASVSHNASIYSCCVWDPGPVPHLYGLRG